ncbi:hypothetical protein V6N13_122567 [Hibiscus sabdariffa]
MPQMLERPVSPIDHADSLEPKKAKSDMEASVLGLLANGGLSVDDVGVKNRVNDMAQDLNGIGGTIKNVSYAQVAASGGWTVDGKGRVEDWSIGKVGKENASNGLKIRSKVESRASTKVALSKWASSVLNQIEESVSQGNDKEVPSVRGIDEVDPGDPRVMKVVNDMEDRDTVEEVDVDVGDGMMS